MEERFGEPAYSIAAVSKLTGISCHALRVWERRYGYPTPSRSEAGQRRYGQKQVRSLRHIARELKTGRAIGEVMRELPRWELAEESASRSEQDSARDVESVLSEALRGSEATLDRLEPAIAPIDFLARVLEPVLVETGERLLRGELKTHETYLISAMALRRVVTVLEGARRVNRSPRRSAIVAAVAGDHHEGGLLMLSAALELSGWRALILGADLPVSVIKDAVEAMKPDAVGVSFVLSRNIKTRFEELAGIRSVPVFVGGRSMLNHERLARNHGLLPLTGAVTGALAPWLGRFKDTVD